MDKFKVLIVLLIIVLGFNIYFASQLMILLKNQNPTLPSGTPLNLTTSSLITPSTSYKDSVKLLSIKISEDLNIKKDGKYLFHYTVLDNRIINSSILLVFYDKEDNEVTATLQLSQQNPYGIVDLDKGNYN
ncbi:MAG: hypothetical protein QXO96_03685, partial [Sulfolobales archaeon]